MISCSTLSAIVRRKSLSPLFAASSERANLSSVVGFYFSVRLKSRNSTFSDRPGAHLALNEYGTSFSTAVSTSMRLRNYTICADATGFFSQV